MFIHLTGNVIFFPSLISPLLAPTNYLLKQGTSSLTGQHNKAETERAFILKFFEHF
jgi:hypothetical protein